MSIDIFILTWLSIVCFVIGLGAGVFLKPSTDLKAGENYPGLIAIEGGIMIILSGVLNVCGVALFPIFLVIGFVCLGLGIGMFCRIRQ